MVYYQQQNVALLAQISKQVSSITPQVSIPSSPPPPYPDFTPNSSDVRVNAYWFMSLIFSLSAALVGTLVQQWVRDYMQVFQQYDNSLKGARLRQYLSDGVEGWYMPIVAESVPGLIHVSLFLFFLGVIESLLSINTTVGITTIVPIAICGVFYVLSTIAPILDLQSPFQTPFSSLLWYLTRKLDPRTYLDRASRGDLKPVNSTMSERQMQLAMEENGGRKRRDVKAMRWLIRRTTEDDEMDSFVVAIPGAFTSEWGVNVWKMVAKAKEDEGANSRPNDDTVEPQAVAASDQSSLPPQNTQQPRGVLYFLRQFLGPSPVNRTPHDVTPTRSISPARNDQHAARDLVIPDFFKRVRHLLDTCISPSSELSSHKRARACVETVASLVLCANAKPEPFGGLERLLRKLGETEVRGLSAGSDCSFVTRWACLFLAVVTREKLNDPDISRLAHDIIKHLSKFQIEDDGEQIDTGNIDDKAHRTSKWIDDHFEDARQLCVRLGGALCVSQEGRTKEEAWKALAHDHKADIPKLESAASVSDQMKSIDILASEIDDEISYALLPGVSFDKREPIQPAQFFSAGEGQVFMPQIVFLAQRLQLLSSYAPKLCDGVYQETLEGLEILWNNDDCSRSVVGRPHLMERQLWRLQDLRDGGGFGFLVELFFLVLAQLLSMASSEDTHATLYIGTFRTITTGWDEHHKYSVGTQRVIINLICDIVVPDRGVISNHTYPEYITDELLGLLRKIVDEHSRSHNAETMQELRDNLGLHSPILNVFAKEAVDVIDGRAQAPVHP
jgi:hypothetical protein